MGAIIAIILISIAIAVPLIILKNKIGKERILLIVKIMAITLFTLSILRSFLNDNFIWIINGGYYSEVYYKSQDILQSILRWFMTLALIVYPCAAFFKLKTLKNFAVYVCLPASIVALFFYNDFLNYFLTSSGRAIFAPAWLRHIEFSLELIMMIVIPILLRFAIGHKFDVKNKKEWANFWILLPLCLLVCVPVTLPQSLFGFTTLYMNLLSLQHIMWIVTIFALLLVLYLMFRFKDKETRYAVCVFLALYLFYHYNTIYLMDLKMSRLPFQLCNLGSYFVLIALLIKKQSFFDFVLMANVPGAMIAFVALDVSEGMLSYWNIHFYIEHTWVFVIPLLIACLRVFDRPSKGAIKHFFVGFSIYFLSCAIAGIIANCFLYQEGSEFFNEVNYFYIFDTRVASILTFLGFTRLLPVTLGGYSFYPLYMAMIYMLFSVYCLGIYYVYKCLCKVGDDHFRVRQMRIELFEENGLYKKRKSIPKKFYED